MKNKKMTYVFLFAVLVVWGVVFYRIFQAFWGEDELVIPRSSNVAIQDEVFQNDSVALLVNYRDPFLGKAYVKKVNTQSIPPITQVPATRNVPRYIPPKPAKKPPQKNEKEDFLPKVEYFGYIKNHKKNTLIASLRIAGRYKRLAVGEAFHGVKVLEILAAKLVVEMGGEKHEIYLPGF